MTRKERVFAAVTDEGVTANLVAEVAKIDHRKARGFLWELANEGRIARAVGPACVAHYFLTEQAAARFSSGDIKKERVLSAITESGWTVRKLMAALSMTRTTIDAAVEELEREGKVHAVNWRNATTYFPTKEAARAFRFGTKPTPALPPTVEFKATVKKFIEGAQIIVPQGVKVQECPPFRGLGFSETQPKERAFSSLGVGRYLPDEEAMLRRVARKGA